MAVCWCPFLQNAHCWCSIGWPCLSILRNLISAPACFWWMAVLGTAVPFRWIPNSLFVHCMFCFCFVFFLVFLLLSPMCYMHMWWSHLFVIVYMSCLNMYCTMGFIICCVALIHVATSSIWAATVGGIRFDSRITHMHVLSSFPFSFHYIALRTASASMLSSAPLSAVVRSTLAMRMWSICAFGL